MTHELKDISIDETNISEYQKDPLVLQGLEDTKAYLLPQKYTCKVCEKEVYFGKETHIKKYHSDKNGLKCPKCGKECATYLKGWFVFEFNL